MSKAVIMRAKSNWNNNADESNGWDNLDSIEKAVLIVREMGIFGFPDKQFDDVYDYVYSLLPVGYRYQPFHRIVQLLVAKSKHGEI